MVSTLYLLVVTVLLLVALAVTVPVLVDIFREGLQRQGTLDESETETTDAAPQSPPADDTATETGVCTHCGTRNDPEFTYCQQCTERL